MKDRGDSMQTLNIPVDDAVLVQDVNGGSDLFTVESDNVFLQPQPGHLFQSTLITVLHEDVHLFLEVNLGQSRLPNHHAMTASRGKRILPGGVPLRSIAPGWGV